jgi:hypothetical protein
VCLILAAPVCGQLAELADGTGSYWNIAYIAAAVERGDDSFAPIMEELEQVQRDCIEEAWERADLGVWVGVAVL